MKRPSTVRAVDLFHSERPRDRLFVRGWAGSNVDPELAGLITHVLGELEAAEAEVARLKLEAADRAETRASQEDLGLRERPHLVEVGSASVVITPERPCEWLRRAVGEK